MQCSLLRSDLLRPLQLVCSGMARPVGGDSIHLLLCVSPNELCLSSCDGALQIRVSLALKEMKTSGILAISGRKLLDFCRMLPEDALLTLVEQNGVVEVKSAKTRAKFATLGADHVPLVEAFSPTGEGDIDISEFRQLLSGVGFSMANQDVRYYLNGLQLCFDEQGVCAIATDGHRLAYGKIFKESGFKQPHKVLLPRKSVLELGRFLDFLGEGTAHFQYGPKGFSVSTPNAWFSTHLLAGNFPSCEGMLQMKLPYCVEVKTLDLKQALLRASIVCQEKPRKVRILFAGGTLRLSASNAVQEMIEEELNYQDSAHPEVEIGFDLSYLLDVLNALKAPTLTIQFKSFKHLVKLSEPSGSGFTYIIMPMLL